MCVYVKYHVLISSGERGMAIYPDAVGYGQAEWADVMEEAAGLLEVLHFWESVKLWIALEVMLGPSKAKEGLF